MWFDFDRVCDFPKTIIQTIDTKQFLKNFI